MNKKQIGQKIKDRMTERGVTAYRLTSLYSKEKIMSIQSLKSILDADRAYTIDSLLAVLDFLELEIEIRPKAPKIEKQ